MSKYLNYERASQTYDELRHAGHVDTMANVVCGMLRKKAEDVCMLEAGCGTGNFSLGFLKNGIGHLRMIDASPGMLERAKQKVQGFDAVKEIQQHVLPSIPYEDETFDAVTLIQVLHHLDTYHLKKDAFVVNGEGCELNGNGVGNGDGCELNGNGVGNGESFELNGNGAHNHVDESDMVPYAPVKNYRVKYPNLVSTIQEAYRVLKPNGVLVIDTSFEHNIDAHWIALAPKAKEIFKQAFMPGNDLIELLQAENYTSVFFANNPANACARTGLYDNAELIFDENWRNSCSEWSFINRTGELAGILDLVKKKKAEGKLEEFAWEMNKKFRLVGETTTVFAQKAASSG